MLLSLDYAAFIEATSKIFIAMSQLFEKPLQFATPQAWVNTVLSDFDTFLCDHASAEKKASGMAINMISHYPDRTELVNVMSELAIEELNHYREVIKLIHARGNHLSGDTKDPYVVDFRKAIRQGGDVYLLDRLLIGGIIEARGAERFGLIGLNLEESKLKRFYQAIAKSEERHHEVFFNLACSYFEKDQVAQRIAELTEFEAAICAKLPLRAALH